MVCPVLCDNLKQFEHLVRLEQMQLTEKKGLQGNIMCASLAQLTSVNQTQHEIPAIMLQKSV